ncbi:MAG: hypothetical protein CVV25_07995 [Ignavibacteriae bacterium HGW-Ignavibacteriae-4]|nr:MAG: hypothetical protein CVV25_07995 [Ignavibacteriae bacterium HGW-Ignavibacteriae-4]
MTNTKIYKQRFDFYWKSVVIYIVVLIGYGLIRMIIGHENFGIITHDPVFILLSLFISGSLLMYLHKLFWLRTLVIDENSITIKNRFNESTFTKDNITKIFLGRERPFQSRETFRVVKIDLLNRKRKIRIRPHNYWDDKQLFDDIRRVKDRIGK